MGQNDIYRSLGDRVANEMFGARGAIGSYDSLGDKVADAMTMGISGSRGLVEDDDTLGGSHEPIDRIAEAELAYGALGSSSLGAELGYGADDDDEDDSFEEDAIAEEETAFVRFEAPKAQKYRVQTKPLFRRMTPRGPAHVSHDVAKTIWNTYRKTARQPKTDAASAAYGYVPWDQVLEDELSYGALGSSSLAEELSYGQMHRQTREPVDRRRIERRTVDRRRYDARHVGNYGAVAPAQGFRYRGHDVAAAGNQGFIVQPYGVPCRTAKAAKQWIDRHIAREMR